MQRNPQALKNHLKELAPDRLKHLRAVQKFHLRAVRTGPRGTLHSLVRMPSFAWNSRILILAYPDLPVGQGALWKICQYRGYRLTDDPRAAFDMAVKWDYDTLAPADEVLLEVAQDRPVLNLGVDDIRKSTVDRVFREVFGYGAEVDPTSYMGTCLEKHDMNARNAERIIECPISRPRSDRVYQRLIDTEVEPGITEELRVPIYGREIPFVRARRRPISSRFEPTHQVEAGLLEADDAFSREVQEDLLRFAERMGLEFGELDVLVDRHEERPYVVDVNPTASGVPVKVGPNRFRQVIERMSDAFDRLLLDPISESRSKPPSANPDQVRGGGRREK